MSCYLKDPQSRIAFPMVWPADFAGGAAIVDSVWTVTPAGLTVEQAGVEDLTAMATIAGGRAGEVYRVTNRVTLSDGRSDARAILVRVEPR